MELKKLRVIGIYKSYPKKESCTVVLKEVSGERKLMVRVGLFEGESILMAMENIVPKRPLVHDLFYAFTEVADVRFKHVIIYRVNNGIFYSKIFLMAEGKQTAIEARTCDAIALAVRFNAPVYTTASILKKAGVVNHPVKEAIGSQPKRSPKKNTKKIVTTGKLAHAQLDELKIMLGKAVDKEDYELASMIRDELLKRKINK